MGLAAVVNAVSKTIGALIVIAALLFVVVVKYSAIESRFECTGSVVTDGNPQPLTIFTKLERYRWWVGLWSDSVGALYIEVPGESVDYINHIPEAGDYLTLYDDDLRGGKEMRGNFSTLSRYLEVETSYFGFFKGYCKQIGDT